VAAARHLGDRKNPADGADKPPGTRTRNLPEGLFRLKSRNSGVGVDVSDSAKLLASRHLA
jgi:hypothetical protein